MPAHVCTNLYWRKKSDRIIPLKNFLSIAAFISTDSQCWRKHPYEIVSNINANPLSEAIKFTFLTYSERLRLEKVGFASVKYEKATQVWSKRIHLHSKLFLKPLPTNCCGLWRKMTGWLLVYWPLFKWQLNWFLAGWKSDLSPDQTPTTAIIVCQTNGKPLSEQSFVQTLPRISGKVNRQTSAFIEWTIVSETCAVKSEKVFFVESWLYDNATIPDNPPQQFHVCTSQHNFSSPWKHLSQSLPTQENTC